MARVVETEKSGLVPAVDPAAPYFSRLSARSALYTDFRLLMDSRTLGRAPVDYRALVLEQNVLARGTVAARRKLWKELKGRYGLSSPDPLFDAFVGEWNRCVCEPERGLTAYVLFCMNDRLAADLGITWLAPLLRRAPAEVRASDVLAFLSHSESTHPEVAAWTDQTRLAVARKYCASIRDFGLAKGAVRKTTVRPALYGAPVRLLIRVLRMSGVRLPEVLRSPLFRLLALEMSDIVEALGELNRNGALRFRIQGDVIELELEESP